jgi:hypothetical protein
MPTVRIPNNWNPRPYQQKCWNYFERGGKRYSGVWHRRAGKDDVCLHLAAVKLHERIGNYWHMLPEYSQARKAIWEAVNPHTGKKRIDEAFPKELRKRTNNQEMFIEFKCGSTWQVVGSDSYDSLVGTTPIGVVFSEWALADPNAWAYLSPILEENGGWAAFITTSRGDNHAKSMHEMLRKSDGGLAEILTPEDTGVFTKAQLARILDELIELYGESEGTIKFQQEYLCMWVNAYRGKRVYPDFNRRVHVADDDLLPVIQEAAKMGKTIIRGWDHSGLQPACVITYLNSIGQWYIVREFWEEDADIVEFGDGILNWCEINLPGAKFRDIGDPAGNIRDSRKKSANQYLREELELFIEDGIQTFKVRRTVVNGRLSKLAKGEPAFLVDPSCVVAIDGFEGGYCYPEIGKDTGVYKTEPDKTGSNKRFTDVHDAIQYPATRLFSQLNAEEENSRDDFDNRSGRSTAGGY